MGTTYGTIVGTPSLRLRDTPNLEGKTLTLLSEGAHYVVTGEEGDFLKVSVDSDLEGYVFKEYMKTSVEFNKAVSVEEEKALLNSTLEMCIRDSTHPFCHTLYLHFITSHG